MRENETKYAFFELLAVCFLATAGIFVRKSTLSPINTGLWRMILAFPFLFILAFKDFRCVDKKDIPLMILSGVFLAGDLVFFNMALVRTSLANTNLLTNMTAFIIVPISYFVFKEKIPKFYLLGLAISILGVVVLVTGKVTPSRTNYLGDIFAAIACIFYGLYFLSTYKLRDILSSNIILFFGAIGTIIALLLVSFFAEGLQAPNNFPDFLNLLAFAVFVQVIGHNLLAHCQGHLSVNLSSAITLMQPVVAAIYSVLLFGEKLSIKEIIGMIIVIIGVYICKKQYS